MLVIEHSNKQRQQEQHACNSTQQAQALRNPPDQTTMLTQT